MVELISIGYKYAEMIKTGSMNFRILHNLEVPKRILFSCYLYMANRGIIEGIEKEGEEKEEYLSASVEFTGKVDLLYAKALYALNYFFNEISE